MTAPSQASPLNQVRQALLVTGEGLGPGTYPTVGVAFDTVPPGFVWTASIAITMSQQLTPGANSRSPLGSPNDADYLASMIWTLYRNGNAEVSWLGPGMLCDVQGFGNDVLAVGGQPGYSLVTANPNPVTPPRQVSIALIGYSGPEGQVPLVTPHISTSAISPNALAPLNTPAGPIQNQGVVVTTAGTTTLINDSIAVQLWALQLTASITGSTGSTLPLDVRVEDVFGQLYGTLQLGALGVATAPNSVGQAVAIPLYGDIVQPGQMPLSLIVVASAGTIRVGAVVVFNTATSL